MGRLRPLCLAQPLEVSFELRVVLPRQISVQIALLVYQATLYRSLRPHLFDGFAEGFGAIEHDHRHSGDRLEPSPQQGAEQIAAHFVIFAGPLLEADDVFVAAGINGQGDHDANPLGEVKPIDHQAEQLDF